MSEQAVKIVIPAALDFSALHLTRDSATGNVSFDWRPIEAICQASSIDLALFRDSPEDNVAGLLVAWYAAHRVQGGDPDSVAEELLLEIAIEDAIGLYRVTPERGN